MVEIIESFMVKKYLNVYGIPLYAIYLLAHHLPCY